MAAPAASSSSIDSAPTISGPRLRHFHTAVAEVRARIVSTHPSAWRPGTDGPRPHRRSLAPDRRPASARSRPAHPAPATPTASSTSTPARVSTADPGHRATPGKPVAAQRVASVHYRPVRGPSRSNTPCSSISPTSRRVGPARSSACRSQRRTAGAPDPAAPPSTNSPPVAPARVHVELLVHR